MNLLKPFHRFIVHCALNILLKKLESSVIDPQKPDLIPISHCHIGLFEILFSLFGRHRVVFNCPFLNFLCQLYSSIVLIKLLPNPFMPCVDPFVFLKNSMPQLFLSLRWPCLQSHFGWVSHYNQVVARDQGVLTWNFEKGCILTYEDVFPFKRAQADSKRLVAAILWIAEVFQMAVCLSFVQTRNFLVNKHFSLKNPINVLLWLSFSLNNCFWPD